MGSGGLFSFVGFTFIDIQWQGRYSFGEDTHTGKHRGLAHGIVAGSVIPRLTALVCSLDYPVFCAGRIGGTGPLFWCFRGTPTGEYAQLHLLMVVVDQCRNAGTRRLDIVLYTLDTLHPLPTSAGVGLYNLLRPGQLCGIYRVVLNCIANLSRTCPT